MAKILITEFMDAPSVEKLRNRHEVNYQPALIDNPEQLHKLADGVDALIVRNRTQVKGELLESLNKCIVVGRLGVGLDNIDIAGCERRQIKVVPATGANSLSVAEYVVASTFQLLRGVFHSTQELNEGKWPRNQLANGREINGKTIGLIGFGSTGQNVARLANALGMNVQAYDAGLTNQDPVFAKFSAKRVDLIELLTSSDVISLHVPLIPTTQNLINDESLSLIKRGAVLINTARGGVVDESALQRALKDGRLGGAAIDVFEEEPLVSKNQFDGCQNLILTPHIAGLSEESNQRVSELIANRIIEELS